VVGKAPDLFEGVMMPELYLADALGAVGKPLLRVHTAGSVGGATGLVATSLVQAGIHRRVLAVAFEKQSESNAMWALSIAPPFSLPVVAGAGGYFAPHIRAYIRRSGAPPHIGAMVAVKDRRNGALNPYAHLQQADITLESVQASPMLWDPVRYDETCPSSDGACAVIIGDEEAAAASQAPVAWIRATAMRSEPTMFAGKDHVNPRAGAEAAAALWRQAGITDPLNEIDVAEIYVPFSWYEPMWLENLGFAAPGDGWRMTEAGETALGGRLPVNPSGGVLSSNPIGASGLLRFAEAALQVMDKAGAHQVPGARTALGHAYGGGSQFFSMWVVSNAPRLFNERGALPGRVNRTPDSLNSAPGSRGPGVPGRVGLLGFVGRELRGTARRSWAWMRQPAPKRGYVATSMPLGPRPGREGGAPKARHGAEAKG
jgi:acetyl-CoA C-acetyltransferase